MSDDNVFVALRVRPFSRKELAAAAVAASAAQASNSSFAGGGAAASAPAVAPFQSSNTPPPPPPTAGLSAEDSTADRIDRDDSSPASLSPSASSVITASSINQQPQQQPTAPPSILCIENETNTIHLLEPDRDWYEREAFVFSKVFWSMPPEQAVIPPGPCAPLFAPPPAAATQQDVFDVVGQPAVENCLKGINCCIFAYGQTGAGKSHSMLGTPSDPGVAPLLVRRLFEVIEQRRRDAEEQQTHQVDPCEVLVELGFLEIYNEKVRDLLTSLNEESGGSSQRPRHPGEQQYSNCRVRNHPEKGTFVEGLQRLTITDADQCLEAITAGMSQRATAPTNMNDTSSRSHGIFQLCVTQRFPARGITRTALVNLVDLAGSERVSKSGVTGAALVEATKINMSLSTLRKVIDVLIENAASKKKKVAPFRESHSTHVSSDSLGGNSKTVMIAAVSPAASNFEDTLSTLRYALKAKAIVCSAKVNEEKNAAVMSSLRGEMEQLRQQLSETSSASITNELSSRQREIEDMMLRQQRWEESRASREDEIEKNKAQIEQTQALLIEAADPDALAEQRRADEAELEQLQLQSVASFRLLSKESAQRQRAEQDLEAATQLRERAERVHQRNERALSKAVEEANQLRVRQLLSTFQTAFVRLMTGQNLDELRRERERLLALRDEAQQEKDATAEVLERCEGDKIAVTRRLEHVRHQVQKVADSDLLSSQSSGADFRLKELRRQQKAADAQLLTATSELDVALVLLAQLHPRAPRHVAEYRVEKAQLETEIAELDRQTASMRTRIASHSQLVDQFRSREQASRAEQQQHEARLARVEDNNDHHLQNIAALREALARERGVSEEMAQLVHRKQSDYDQVTARLRDVVATLEEVQVDNGALRSQMDEIFLPPKARDFWKVNSAAVAAATLGGAGAATAAGAGAAAATADVSSATAGTTPSVRTPASSALTPRASAGTTTPLRRANTPNVVSVSRADALAAAAAVAATAKERLEQQKQKHQDLVQVDVRSGGIHYYPPVSAKRRFHHQTSSQQQQQNYHHHHQRPLLNSPGASPVSPQTPRGGVGMMSTPRRSGGGSGGGIAGGAAAAAGSPSVPRSPSSSRRAQTPVQQQSALRPRLKSVKPAFRN